MILLRKDTAKGILADSLPRGQIYNKKRRSLNDGGGAPLPVVN